MLNREKFLFKIDFGSQLHCDSVCSDKMRSMLCDMVEMALLIERCSDAICACKFAEITNTIERATGRSWEDVQKIARECVG